MSKFQEVLSGQEKVVLFPGLRCLVQALGPIFLNSKDIEGLLSLDEDEVALFWDAHWPVFKLSVVEAIGLLHEQGKLDAVPLLYLKDWTWFKKERAAHTGKLKGLAWK